MTRQSPPAVPLSRELTLEVGAVSRRLTAAIGLPEHHPRRVAALVEKHALVRRLEQLRAEETAAAGSR